MLTLNQIFRVPRREDGTQFPESTAPTSIDPEQTANELSEEQIATAYPDTSAAELDIPLEGRHVIHQALKGLDVSFGMQVAALERDARSEAAAWAEQGLPRHDLEASRPIEVEKSLENRAVQIYWQWVREVRRRVNGAISLHVHSMGTAITGAKRAFEACRQIQRELEQLNPRFPRTQRTSAPDGESPDRANPEATRVDSSTSRDTHLAEPQLSTLALWLLTVALVLAEFIANAPIFSELLPQDAQLDAQLAAWLDPASGMSWLTGVKHLAGRLLAFPDPAFLAFSLVVFFLFLGHQLGGQLRAWVALRSPHPEITDQLRCQLRRQAILVVGASAVGILMTVGVLFWARATVFETATKRYEYARQQLDDAKAKVAKAEASTDRREVNSARANRNFWSDEFEFRQRRLDYAESISKMNGAVAGLNIVLIIVATVAGFTHRSVVVTSRQKLAELSQHAVATKNESADSDARRSRGERIETLREELRVQRVELTSRLFEAEQAFGRSNQLIDEEPMREWYGIAARLESAVLSFRIDNARLRHLDTRDIKAFGEPLRLDLPQPSFKVAEEAVKQLGHQRIEMIGLMDASNSMAAGVRNDRRISRYDSLAADGFEVPKGDPT